MDIHIQGKLDGIETSTIIHERYGIPVILLTAHAEADTVARATRSEPFAYILKPFEERELAAAIEVALYKAGMESRIRASEEKYRRLFTEGLSAHALCDSKGRIFEANRAFRNLTGTAAENGEIAVSSVFENPLEWERIRVELGKSGVFSQSEMNIRTSGGEIRPVLAQAVLVRGASRGPDLVQCEFVDLTERRKLEDSLIQAQKMDAIGKLAGGIAHDFNNILTAIIGYADILAAETDLDSVASDDLKGIRSTAVKAIGLTRQLLSFSRKQPYSPSVFDVNVFVRDSEKMLRRLLPPKVSLGIQAYAAHAEVLADSGQMGQAILNLVVNARDAMPEGGSITVRTVNRTLGPPSGASKDNALAEGEYACIEVSDTGPGIPATLRPFIFQPFFTTKSEGKGTGLGLSIVESIMKRSRGAVFLDAEGDASSGTRDSSTPRQGRGPGAKFSLLVPLASETASGSEAPVPWGDAAGRSSRDRFLDPGIMRGRKILIVDDDEEIVSITSRMLARAGFDCLGAPNAGEALLIAESGFASIGIVIADAVLPHMDGESLCARLAGLLPGIGLLLMSGHPEWIPDLDDAKKAGTARHFLAKPFTETQLLESIAQVLRDLPPFGESTSR
jgi:two-component system cell cycle sensor histidine kinase/response regulator CckA